MSYQQYQEQLSKELQSINFLIDEKIMRGLSYAAEARRHKALIRQMRRERRQPLLSKMLSYVSLF